MNHLTKPSIVKLNANWQPIGFTNAQTAFTDMVTGVVVGLHLEWVKDAKGEYNFDAPENMWAVESWYEWAALEVREYDDSVKIKNGLIRIPPVVIARNYRAMPMVRPKFSKHTVLERDNYTCQYTGKKFNKGDAKKHLNIDHVIPRTQGGRSSWDNVVASSIDVNSKKGGKTPHEAGLDLLRSPKEPFPRPKMSEMYEDLNRFTDQQRWLIPA